MSGLMSAVDELAAAAVEGRGDAALGAELVELRAAIDRLEAEWLRRLAVFDRRQGWRGDGALSAQAWLRSACRLAPGAARERTAVARRLGDLPLTAAALAAGEIGYPHVRVIAAAAAEARAHAMAEAEPALVDAARELDASRLRVVVAHWRHAVDPEASVDDAVNAYDRRELYACRGFEGTVVVDGQLDPEGGETVLTALNALAQEALTPGDRRTPAQRRADALVELARRALDAAALPDVSGERPHVVVTVDLATLERRAGARAAEFDWAGPVCGETARRLACDAGITRVITAGTSQPLDVGRRSRSVPPALRRALAVRDGGCRFPGCDRPPAWTDAHHLVHWADGGPTSLDNVVLLCRAHHRLVHEQRWTLTRQPDGQLSTAPPGPARIRPPP